MPDREIPTLDTILNEPNIDRRMNYLIGIAYTNYDSINNINEKIDEICNERGMNKKEKGLFTGGVVAGIVMGIGALIKSMFPN